MGGGGFRHPLTSQSLPFCVGVQFSRYSLRVLSDWIKTRENREQWTVYWQVSVLWLGMCLKHGNFSLRAGSLVWMGYRGQRWGSRNRKLARRMGRGKLLFLASFFSPVSPVLVCFVAFDRDPLSKQVRLLAGYWNLYFASRFRPQSFPHSARLACPDCVCKMLERCPLQFR